MESLEEDAYRRLQYERSTWHNDLDNLVQGGFASEDTELAITLARCASLIKSLWAFFACSSLSISLIPYHPLLVRASLSRRCPSHIRVIPAC